MLDTELIASGPERRRTPFSSSTMKHTFLALMFAMAPLAAQGSEKARTELAKAIAVEEQERDLAKAEKAYREAIDDKELSVQARELAKERLGYLLQRLGRDAEAKQYLPSDKGTIATLDDVTGGLQDAERVKALRAKARELVGQVLEQSGVRGIGIADSQLRDQLVWIGEPAIPEIAAALAQEKPESNFSHSKATDHAVAGLAGLLWYYGGPTAESHLETLLRDASTPLRSRLVFLASELRDPRMLRLAERWLRQEQDDNVAMQLLTSSVGGPLSRRLDAEVMLDDVLRRPVNTQIYVLDAVGVRADVSRAALAKAHALVRTFVTGADPDLGRAAQRFLTTTVSQSSPDGVLLLLEQLPHMQTVNLQNSLVLPDEWLLPAPNQASTQPVRKEVAERVWPSLVACATAFPAAVPNWLQNRLHRFAHALDASIVPDLLLLSERGNLSLLSELPGKVNAANAAAVFALYDQLASADRKVLLDIVGGAAELPAELFVPLRERAEACMAADANDKGGSFVFPIAKTGHRDAGAWLLAYADRGGDSDLAVSGLLALGKRAGDDAARAALRAAVPKIKGPYLRIQLVLAQLALGDEPTLQQVVAGHPWSGASHPYAKNASTAITPVEYLLYADVDPPHPFSQERVLALLPELAAKDGELVRDVSRLSDRMLAAGVAARVPGTAWDDELLRRLVAEPPGGELRRWLDETLRTRGRGIQVLVRLNSDDEIARIRPQLDALLASDDADAAELAFHTLARASQPLDFDALMQSKHEKVREEAFWEALQYGRLSNEEAIAALANNRDNHRIAEYLGSRVAVEAVPALIGLLKDPNDMVRTAAAEALNKIRFHHEQQAYWDRIVKGLDASPASAAEKLLLQARPGAPKPQRLLAITSLGTLGVPEALPFLIEWTQDPDAEIAKKANEAITQIHLNPRK